VAVIVLAQRPPPVAGKVDPAPPAIPPKGAERWGVHGCSWCGAENNTSHCLCSIWCGTKVTNRITIDVVVVMLPRKVPKVGAAGAGARNKLEPGAGAGNDPNAEVCCCCVAARINQRHLKEKPPVAAASYIVVVG
jgi:hypothetical protein